MSSYVVLARKWRSAQFSDIVGQGPIVRTLMNALTSKRVHQAYLFTGSRGIGKTSIARIFAKALRCENVKEVKAKDGSAWLVSCDKCSNCKEIAGGQSVDVLEIDGASNNGVDAVRDIREGARFMPSHGERKIYIIDEVHMLTTQAFNALLKTLEEPPPHVYFIFATTEAHKIPATILSRCQRFDFKRISPVQIIPHLTKILESEGIAAEPEALEIIAKAADGSMRDSLTLLDQVIVLAGKKITAVAVREAVGLIASESLEGILKCVFIKDAPGALKLVRAAYEQGFDLRVLTESLVETLHRVILEKVGAAASSVNMKALAELRPLDELEVIFQALHYGLDWIARSPQKLAVLEVILIKCAIAQGLAEVGTSTSGGGQTTKPLTTAAAPAPAQVAVMQAAPEVKTTPAPRPGGSWEQFIAHVRKERPLLAALLENASNVELPSVSEAGTQSEVKVYFTPDHQMKLDQIKSKIYKDQLALLSQSFYGKAVGFSAHVLTANAPSSLQETLAQKKIRERGDHEESVKKKIANHPILQEARSLFQAELSDVELTDGNDNG